MGMQRGNKSNNSVTVTSIGKQAGHRKRKSLI